jgi:c-di-AMP phosphodiesterase-like protein
MVKMTLTFDEETIEILRTKAKEEGFIRPSSLVRYLLLRCLKEDTDAELEESGSKTISVKVDNYRELLDYVHEKKLGTVENLATFAIGQYMSRCPLTAAQKQRARERYGF